MFIHGQRLPDAAAAPRQHHSASAQPPRTTNDLFHRRWRSRALLRVGQLSASAGIDYSIVVTDAIAAAGLGPGRYTLGNQTVDVGDDLVARAAGRFAFCRLDCHNAENDYWAASGIRANRGTDRATDRDQPPPCVLHEIILHRKVHHGDTEDAEKRTSKFRKSHRLNTDETQK